LLQSVSDLEFLLKSPKTSTNLPILSKFFEKSETLLLPSSLKKLRADYARLSSS